MPHKDLGLQKCVAETNSYLKDLCGFCDFSFTENYLNHYSIHLNKIDLFLFGQNVVSDVSKYFWHDENVSIESNLQIVNSGSLSASKPNHVYVSDTQDINDFSNDEIILCNLSSSLKTVKKEYQKTCFWKFEN